MTPSGFYDQIKELIDQMRSRSASIQVVGRPLTPDEGKEVAQIDAALPHLESALEALAS